MFTSAGMVQFKDVFTGREKRAYTRATTSQKCLRAGGKHNDLDNVGYTARHHTFFEMLGNFSFGDYFKEEAIAFAWELVTKHLNLPSEKLLVTVYAQDEEAAAIWRKVSGFADSKIIRIDTSDNFWSMGDTGPCGPCTEIFYDHGEGIPGGPPGSPDADGDRFIEIWNLVFMQYDQQPDGSRILLPNPCVDTGMGLERIGAVLQGVHSNYETDLFQTLIKASIDLTANANPTQKQSHNVIADHLRASAFLIADGVLPSNEGRGYVLRRIMRRAMRHAHMLGADEALMHRLVPALMQAMAQAYPELLRAQPLIEQTLRLEEERFRQTLERGLRHLADEKAKLKADAPLPGDVAFKLYDTYGFPLDLTQDVLRAENHLVDVDGFHAAMAIQKKQARASWVGTGDTFNDKIWFDERDAHGATEFVGYTSTQTEAVVVALVRDGAPVPFAKAGDDVLLLTNQTPFYAQSGGQMGDQGFMETDTAHIHITDCQKKIGTLHVHVGRVVSGEINQGDTVRLKVDEAHRRKLAANHSATHLLHAALRKHLGDHVMQKGSLVAADRLRFDFTHTQSIGAQTLRHIENEVNSHILANRPATTAVMTPDEAIAKGAMALFGEKYGDEVRVVTMADGFSTELCGGTHVGATGDIGLFKITAEASVSAGVRRIEAMTGTAIINAVWEAEQTLMQERESSKKHVAELTKQLADVKRAGMMGSAATQADVQRVGPYKAAVRHLEDVSTKDLKILADQMKQELQSGIAIITSVTEGRVSLVIGVTEDLTPHVSAVDLVRQGAAVLGGQGGGGRPDMAQGGGVDASAIRQLVPAFDKWVKQA
jgi:alanyl-tRNA synthetase